jgi:hypothetical protein
VRRVGRGRQQIHAQRRARTAPVGCAGRRRCPDRWVRPPAPGRRRGSRPRTA